MTGLPPKWIVIHGAEDGEGAVLVDQCYSDRDPYGEYIYYAAGNPEAVEDGKISINDYDYLAEVRVTFEADLLEEAAEAIAWCQNDMSEQGDGFVQTVWPSWQEASLRVVDAAIFPPGQDFVMAKSVLSVSYNEAAWVEVTRIEADLTAEMALTLCRIDKDRLLEIKAVLKGADVPIGAIASAWQGLIERFATLPYEHLSGAERVAFEDEGDVFEFEDAEDVGD